MNKWERLHRQAERYKEMYPRHRMELISMDDPYSPVPPVQEERCNMWTMHLRSE